MKPSKHQQFHLATLFVLLATCAVLTGMVSSSTRRWTGGENSRTVQISDKTHVAPEMVAGCVFVGAMCGLFLGGGLRPQPIRGGLFGATIGMVAGAVTGLMLMYPPAISEFAGGCAIILATGVLFRVTGARESR